MRMAHLHTGLQTEPMSPAPDSLQYTASSKQKRRQGRDRDFSNAAWYARRVGSCGESPEA